MKNFTLRDAVEEDAPSIADLIYDTEDLPEHIWGQGTKDEILNRIKLLILSDNSRYSYLNVKVAQLNDKICGAIILLDSEEIAQLDAETSLKLLFMIKGIRGKMKFIKDFIRGMNLKEGGKRELYIANVATDKSVRGFGIGKELMKLAEKIAKREGYRGCSLLAKDKKVRRFYEKLDYKFEKKERYCSQYLYRMIKIV